MILYLVFFSFSSFLLLKLIRSYRKTFPFVSCFNNGHLFHFLLFRIRIVKWKITTYKFDSSVPFPFHYSYTKEKKMKQMFIVKTTDEGKRFTIISN